jgi:hypothetical protein
MHKQNNNFGDSPMNHVILIGIAASALAISALSVVGAASAAPTGPSDVDETVRSL